MKKILIIDDDPDNLFLLATCVREMNNEVITRSKVILIEDIIELSPDLVMLDHWINGKFGGDLCLAIKNNPATSNIPVIIISAVVDLKDIAGESCADEYIEKPFDFQNLLNVVERCLNVSA